MRTWDKSRPPVGPFTLNRDSPQAVGLVAWYPGTGGGLFVPDYVGAAHATSGTAGTTTLNNAGAPVLVFASASSQYVEALSCPITAVPLSISAWVTAGNWTTAQIVAAICTNGGDARIQLQLGDGTNAGTLFRTYNSSASSDYAQLSSGATLGVEAHVAGTTFGATSRYTFINGVGTSQNTTNIASSGWNRVVIGARRATAGIAGYLNGGVRDVRIYSRDIYAAEWKQHIDPGVRYELWYPLRSRKWFTAGAGGAITINCSVGNAVAAGAAATISVDQTIACSVGNAAAAGVAATISTAQTVACGVGNAVAAGVASSISAAQTVACSIGNATAAGITAGISLGSSIVVDCAVGNTVAAGTTATISIAQTVSASVGNAVAAGTTCAIALGADATINCTVGNAVAAGVVCAIEVDGEPVNCSTGNAVAAGTACQILLGITLDCTVGNAVAAGIYATFPRLSAPPIGHGPALAARRFSIARKRQANLSTRIR